MQVPFCSLCCFSICNQSKKSRVGEVEFTRYRKPAAKRAVQVPHWSCGEMRGRFKWDLAVTIRLKLGFLCSTRGDVKGLPLLLLLYDRPSRPTEVYVEAVEILWREECCTAGYRVGCRLRNLDAIIGGSLRRWTQFWVRRRWRQESLHEFSSLWLANESS